VTHVQKAAPTGARSVPGDRTAKPALPHLALAALLASTGCSALAEPVACPPSITVSETLTGAPPEPWTARYDNTRRNLAGVDFYDGHPDEQRSLAPSTDSGGRNPVATWKFSNNPLPVWLSCRYQDSAVTLARPLPAYRECRVSQGPGGIVRTIDCR
jgi:hypothetical protein